MRRTIQYGIGSLATAALLFTGVQTADAATTYAGASQELENLTVEFGASDGGVTFSSNADTDGHVDGSGTVDSDSTDPNQSYTGPSGTAPSENDFSFKGETDADYGRGDALLSIGDETADADTVGEAYLDGGGAAGGDGKWAMEADLTFGAADTLTLSTDYDWALDIAATGDLSSFASARVSVDAVLYDADTDEAVHSFDDFSNELSSVLTREDPEFDVEQSETGTADETSVEVGAGDYRLAIEGSSEATTTAVPEPTTGLLLGGVMGGLLIRRPGRRPT